MNAPIQPPATLSPKLQAYLGAAARFEMAEQRVIQPSMDWGHQNTHDFFILEDGKNNNVFVRVTFDSKLNPLNVSLSINVPEPISLLKMRRFSPSSPLQMWYYPWIKNKEYIKTDQDIGRLRESTSFHAIDNSFKSIMSTFLILNNVRVPSDHLIKPPFRGFDR
jgi:hypothetical protein